MHSRKSILFGNDSTWTKKNSDDMFDVTMRSFDGAEICQLVRSFVLSSLIPILGKTKVSLYRDDGLAVMNSSSPRQCDKMRKNIISIFHAFDLRITIQANIHTTNFLDVTLSLQNGSFKPYSKPNNQLLYINSKSNHPPFILKQIPASINRRISNISDSSESFHQAAPDYEQALQNSGFQHKMEYQTPQPKSSKKNRRVPFPKNFLTIAKTILKRLFRVYAHIYHQHFQEVVRLGEEAHLNTSFKHFIFFVQEFNLIDRKELAPLQELIERLSGK
ncbi:uncharacterized protein LOC117112339 [Anneissia japonica]|uniref:uncharacterized protein LOC117112339 n=1 Tax=Anneissia japonica TaxID=1529436 RepID=UPI00142592B7|nr:uncharacterized protein LOC117112339 [Anneissia japonica]